MEIKTDMKYRSARYFHSSSAYPWDESSPTLLNRFNMQPNIREMHLKTSNYLKWDQRIKSCNTHDFLPINC